MHTLMPPDPGAPPPEPVGIKEIAERAGVQPPTVEQWTRRHAAFPEPWWTVGGRPAWNWQDVSAWLASTGRGGLAAAQVVGRNQSGWLAAYWISGTMVVSRVIAAPERDSGPGLLICWGWCGARSAPFASYGGDIGATLEACARYEGYIPVDAYPLHAFCNRCGAPVSLEEGANGWHHDEPGTGDIMPYREPQPLPGDISKCPNAGRQGAAAGNGETGEAS